MGSLFLDLASHHGLIACVDDVVRSSVQVDHRIADHEVTEKIEECLRSAGWTYENLEGIACVIGPGGFTSLRVAVAAGNALSFALDIPVAGIHLSDLYRARFEGDAWWLHSTKKQELFIRGFGAYASTVPEARLASIADALDLLRSGGEWMGELIPAHEAMVSAPRAPLRPVADVLPAFLAGQAFERHPLLPWYGRGW